MKNIILSVVCVVLLALAVVRMWGCHRDYVATTGVPEGHDQIWRCRNDGYETRLKPGQLTELMKSDKYREDPGNPFNTLFECPQCGQLELELITITPEGEVKQ